MISSDGFLEGCATHKMDAKCRVSLLACWRSVLGMGSLRLLQRKLYGLASLQVLTEQEYGSMLDAVQNHPAMSYIQKKKYLGKLHSRVHLTKCNAQGKLVIPKALCDRVGFELEGNLALLGRGTYIDIVRERDLEAMMRAEDAETLEDDAEFGFFDA